MDPLFQIPEDFAALTVEELNSFIDTARETATAVGANPSEFTVEGRDLIAEMTAGVAAIEAARAELASRSEEPAEVETPEVDADALAELAARAAADDDPEAEVEPEAAVEPEVDPEATAEPVELAVVPEPEAEPVAEEVVEPEVVDAVVAAAPPAPRTRPRPARSRAAAPQAEAPAVVSLVAAGENLGLGLGETIPDEDMLARMMVRRRNQFGDVAEGTHGEKVPIARADWSEMYGNDRTLDDDVQSNLAKANAVIDDALIRVSFGERQKEAGSLTASGGLCAPVTPYYGLQMLSVTDRPVRAALPSFNADRGGIRAARPAALTGVTTAVGTITEAVDRAGGTPAVKGCQRIPCPAFSEVDVTTIYHCIEFGNLGARTFPELVAQWNLLVLAAQARVAETLLLDGIKAASTAVTAADYGSFGASATLPSQVLAAANGMRSRHRMKPDAVLRVMLPSWVLDLLVSDVYRSQFDRFDMGPQDFVRILRAANVEPTFYIDGDTGGSQVFGAQAAGTLLPFPATIRWYLYPEGSFLHLDGGTLELGLVRDSVLNATNDFMIFGETFENVAFIGVESLAITTSTCDNGAVSLPKAIGCPVAY